MAPVAELSSNEGGTKQGFHWEQADSSKSPVDRTAQGIPVALWGSGCALPSARGEGADFGPAD